MTKYVNNDLNLDFNKLAAGRTNRRVEGAVDKEMKGKLLKTVIVNREIQEELSKNQTPDIDLISNFGKNIESAGALDAKIRILEDHIKMLHEQYDSNERHFQLECLNTITKNDEVLEQTLKNEKLICDLNKEIVKQRIQFEQYEFELQNQNEQLRRANLEKANRLAKLEVTAEKERKGIESAIEKQANQFSAKYKEKCKDKEAETEKYKKRYRDMQEAHFKKVKELEAALQGLRDQYQDIKAKKNSELTVYRTELSELKDQYKSTAEQIMLQGLITDQERYKFMKKFSDTVKDKSGKSSSKGRKRPASSKNGHPKRTE